MLRQPHLWSLEDRLLVMEEQENWCTHWCGCSWEIYLHYVTLQEENYCDCHGFRGWPRFLRNAARRSDEIIVVNPACTEDSTAICIYLYSCMLCSNSVSLRAGAVA